MDGLIGATAIARNLTLTTRNILDFDGFEIDLYNPWTSIHPATIYYPIQFHPRSPVPLLQAIQKGIRHLKPWSGLRWHAFRCLVLFPFVQSGTQQGHHHRPG